MSKLLVINSLSLDGVMQAPGRPEEDTRDGFSLGGWAAPYNAMQQTDALGNLGALLFGRWTYDAFAGYFPKHPENPFSGFLESIPKYVATTSRDSRLTWTNTTLLAGDAATTVPPVKAAMEKDLVVFGSGVLVRSLLRSGLVDELVLLIHPLLLGAGRRLFLDDRAFAKLSLLESHATANGVVIVKYQPGA